MARERISPQRQFTVKRHQPIRWWMIRVGLLALLLIGTGVAFEYGRYQGGFDLLATTQHSSRVKDELGYLQAKNRELMDQIAMMERSSQIDRLAYEGGKQRLIETEQGVLLLQKELAFYRGLVAPSKKSNGLAIKDLSLRPSGEKGVLVYKLVLVQHNKNDRFAIGRVEFSVAGEVKGESLVLTSSDLFVETAKKISFKYHYFQVLEGKLRLSAGFAPKRMTISLQPKGKRLKAVSVTYDWSDILLEGD
ncbi:MAG: hypothetical protein Q9N68_04085 [Gammaproteobacteria bacterium]|nr:hypothetical protein [Gammaproteobacteria bacterium]